MPFVGICGSCEVRRRSFITTNLWRFDSSQATFCNFGSVSPYSICRGHIKTLNRMASRIIGDGAFLLCRCYCQPLTRRTLVPQTAPTPALGSREWRTRSVCGIIAQSITCVSPAAMASADHDALAWDGLDCGVASLGKGMLEALTRRTRW